MRSEILARKYASGLFDAGDSRSELDSLYDEAESLLAYLRQERGLLSFLTAPQIKEEDKERVVRESFASRVSPTFLSFLLLLVAKHRIGHLDAILDHFIGLVKERIRMPPRRSRSWSLTGLATSTNSGITNRPSQRTDTDRVPASG